MRWNVAAAALAASAGFIAVIVAGVDLSAERSSSTGSRSPRSW
jgi:2-methylisocitrate lyase-like PEP mutase family enzyme